MLETRISDTVISARERRSADIEASISALRDEDLLDLVAIFSGEHRTPLAGVARAGMERRDIAL